MLPYFNFLRISYSPKRFNDEKSISENISSPVTLLIEVSVISDSPGSTISVFLFNTSTLSPTFKKASSIFVFTTAVDPSKFTESNSILTLVL